MLPTSLDGRLRIFQHVSKGDVIVTVDSLSLRDALGPAESSWQELRVSSLQKTYLDALQAGGSSPKLERSDTQFSREHSFPKQETFSELGEGEGASKHDGDDAYAYSRSEFSDPEKIDALNHRSSSKMDYTRQDENMMDEISRDAALKRNLSPRIGSTYTAEEEKVKNAKRVRTSSFFSYRPNVDSKPLDPALSQLSISQPCHQKDEIAKSPDGKGNQEGKDENVRRPESGKYHGDLLAKLQSISAGLLPIVANYTRRHHRTMETILSRAMSEFETRKYYSLVVSSLVNRVVNVVPHIDYFETIAHVKVCGVYELLLDVYAYRCFTC